MTIRFYILPLDEQGDSRGPKYLKWRDNPTGIDCPWSMKDYGRLGAGIVAADVSDAQHTELSGNADVLSAPVNIDNTIPNTGVRNQVRAQIDTLNIPSQWINVGDSYLDILRTITHLFMFAQRFDGLYGQPIVQPGNGITLGMLISDMPVQFRQALNQTAQSMGYDTSVIIGTDTYRQGLKKLADQWGNAPVVFDFTEL